MWKVIMSERVCQRSDCGKPIRSSRRQDTRWCSRSCEGKARRAAKRKADFEDKYGLVDELLPVEGQSLAELHERAAPPQHRAGIEAGRGDSDLAEFSDQYDVAHLDDGDYDPVPKWAGQDRRFSAMFQGDSNQRTPKETWKRWRAYGRRHGTEDPEQTKDRIERHRAAEAAKMARIDDSTHGRVQDRFDQRTASSVAANARESRRLNARHVEQPPVSSPGFDFRGESVDGGPYRSGRPSGQRSGHAEYAWRMEEGFRF